MDAEATNDAAQSRLFHADQAYRTIRTAIRCGAAVSIAWLGFGAFKEFAGTSTNFDVAISLLVNAFVETKFIMAISLTGLACAWAALERSLRHRKVESMQGRIKELEKMIDPNRSSTTLTPSGKTNPADLRG